MKKALVSFFILFLLTVPSVLAADFSIGMDKTPDSPFYATKTDYITLTINNPLQEDWFTVSVVGVPKDWVTIDTSSSIIKIPGASSGSVKIKVSPSRDAIPNIYQYFLKVTRLSSKDYVETPLLINVVQVTSAILSDISTSCTSCIDSVDVSGKIINVGSKTLDLSLVFKYDDTQKTLAVGKVDSNEKKDFQTTLDLKGMNPDTYGIGITLVDNNGNVLYTDSASFTIPKVENIIYDNKVSSTPFGSLVTVTATNMGNVVSDADLRSVSPQNWYSVISGPTPTGMMTGYYSWVISLNPNESRTVSYSEIYWPTYVFIIAVVLVIAFVYWQTTAFTFKKTVIGKPRLKFGKDISISLHLKSRRRGIERVAIRDIVPPNFSIVSKFETVKPLIRKVSSGIELIWKLGGLSTSEERVLHYTIRPNTEFSRSVNLPSALAKTTSGKGFAVKHSNRVSLHPEREEPSVMTVKIAK